MQSYKLAKRYLFKTTSTVLIVAMSASNAGAVKFPSKKSRYMSKPLQVCDQGVFYVGGAPKTTTFHAGPTPGSEQVRSSSARCMSQFQTPMKAKAWPLIMVHGSGYTGACVEGTAGGKEGWSDYTVRNGIPTYVVDQSGTRALRLRPSRSSTRREYLMAQWSQLVRQRPCSPSFGGPSGSSAWTSWFGHIAPAGYRHHHRPDGPARRAGTVSPMASRHPVRTRCA